MTDASPLIDARKRLGLTQAELAAELGLTQSSISRIETGVQEYDKRTRLAVDALVAEHARQEVAAPAAKAAA